MLDGRSHLRGHLVSAGDIGLADVEQDQHGLLGQEAEAADAQRVVGAEAQVADGAALGQRRQDPLQDDLLPFVGLLLGSRAVPPGLLQLLEALLDHTQVGKRELQLQLFDVTGRIDAQQRVRDRVVLEGAHDMEERVGIAQSGQLVGRDISVRLAFGGRGGSRQVDVA